MSILPDGRVGLGLRDDAGAAFYVGRPDVRGSSSSPEPRFLDLSTGLLHETPELAAFTWL